MSQTVKFGFLWGWSKIVPYTFPLRTSMLKLNYRVFRCMIVLSSYNNRLINLFEAPVHYEWLANNVGSRGLISCGSEGLCFKKEIVLPNGIHCKQDCLLFVAQSVSSVAQPWFQQSASLFVTNLSPKSCNCGLYRGHRETIYWNTCSETDPI